MRRFVRWALPLLAIPALGLLAFGLTRSPQTLPSALIGMPAPQFRLADLHEPADSIVLADYEGRVVVLNFWASWCGPCILEHPYLEELTEVYDPEDVQVLGMLYQDTPERARSFLRRYGGDWPHAVDPGSEVAIPYGVYGPPETFVVTPDGTIAYKLVGPLTPNTYPEVRATIDSLLALRAPVPSEWRAAPSESDEAEASESGGSGAPESAADEASESATDADGSGADG